MEIILYGFETCPWCVKVKERMKELEIINDVVKVDVPRNKEDPIRKSLAEKAGVITVPVMKIDGEFVVRSREIMKRLDEIKNSGELIWS